MGWQYARGAALAKDGSGHTVKISQHLLTASTACCRNDENFVSIIVSTAMFCQCYLRHTHNI